MILSAVRKIKINNCLFLYFQAADYMSQLDSKYVPVSGSIAATQRKQQLQFQVPIHDLNAKFCDTLSENEVQQLLDYATQIKKKYVGQGHVIRMPQLPLESESSTVYRDCSNSIDSKHIEDFLFDGKPFADKLIVDEVLFTVVNSDIVQPILFNQAPSFVCALNYSNLSREVKYHDDLKVDIENQNTLLEMNIDSNSITSALIYGDIYDTIFRKLDDKHINYKANPLIGPICKFRQELNNNLKFKKDLNLILDNHINNSKGALTEILDNKKYSGEGMTNHTQINKSETGNAENNFQVNMLNKDDILDFIFNSDKVRSALDQQFAKLILFDIPIEPNLVLTHNLNDDTAHKLKQLKLNQSVLQSAIENGIIYDKFFSQLNDKHVDYKSCHLLYPLSCFREMYRGDNTFAKDLNGLQKAILLNTEFDAVNQNSQLYNSLNRVAQDTSQLNLSPILKNLNISSNPCTASLSCKTCHTNILPGSAAVKASRMGKNDIWHPQCFVCNMCGELLADLVYFYHNKHIYCGRDLAIILNIPRCNACDELIFTKEYTAAEGVNFHIKHFCCFECDIPLAGLQYILNINNNMPTCLQCYELNYGHKCQLCASAINPNEQGVSWNGAHWHGPCFICTGNKCGKSLMGGQFCIKNNLPFCSSKCVNGK